MNFTTRNVLILDDATREAVDSITPKQRAAMIKAFNERIGRIMELTLYGGHAPPIDPRSVVAEQTPGQKRIE